MTTTAPEDVKASRSERRDGTAADGAIAPPPKLRRRPALVAVSAAAICGGGVLAAWAYTSTSEAQEVIAVRATIERGATIEADDLVSVRIGLDPVLDPIPTSEADDIIGQRAALDIPAGGVVTPEQITASLIPAEGMSVVGISLAAGQLPANQLRVGDPVRVVTVPGAAQGAAQNVEQEAAPEPVDAEVVDVAVDDLSGNMVVNVAVDHDLAPAVAMLSATGSAALVLDTREN